MSRVALALLIIFTLRPLHATYRIGSNPVDFKNAPSFDKANFSSSLDQGKHLASSLNRISL
jgi:hypothetical protein